MVPPGTRGNQSQAAHFLGFARQTLRQRLREAGLIESHRGDGAEDEPD
jgi:DNA-binding protein Fis